MRKSKTVVILSCVSKKLEHEAAAKDLYVSPYFVKCRAYAEKLGHPWVILSALHGVLRPEDVVKPYNVSLKDLDAGQRRKWELNAKKQLRFLYGHGTLYIVLAGADYAGATKGLRRRLPMKGLTIGRRLGWLNKHLLPKPVRGLFS